MGLTVNRQMAKKLTVNRQKRNFFYRLPSNERVQISRQISQICLTDRKHGVTNWWRRRFIRPAVTEIM